MSVAATYLIVRAGDTEGAPLAAAIVVTANRNPLPLAPSPGGGPGVLEARLPPETRLVKVSATFPGRLPVEQDFTFAGVAPAPQISPTEPLHAGLRGIVLTSRGAEWNIEVHLSLGRLRDAQVQVLKVASRPPRVHPPRGAISFPPRERRRLAIVERERLVRRARLGGIDGAGPGVLVVRHEPVEGAGRVLFAARSVEPRLVAVHLPPRAQGAEEPPELAMHLVLDGGEGRGTLARPSDPGAPLAGGESGSVSRGSESGAMLGGGESGSMLRGTESGMMLRGSESGVMLRGSESGVMLRVGDLGPLPLWSEVDAAHRALYAGSELAYQHEAARRQVALVYPVVDASAGPDPFFELAGERVLSGFLAELLTWLARADRRRMRSLVVGRLAVSSIGESGARALAALLRSGRDPRTRSRALSARLSEVYVFGAGPSVVPGLAETLVEWRRGGAPGERTLRVYDDDPSRWEALRASIAGPELRGDLEGEPFLERQGDGATLVLLPRGYVERQPDRARGEALPALFAHHALSQSGFAVRAPASPKPES